MPVNADEPVKDHVPVIPEGFFMKAEGAFSEVMKAPLQSVSPCPNLA